MTMFTHLEHFPPVMTLFEQDCGSASATGAGSGFAAGAGRAAGSGSATGTGAAKTTTRAVRARMTLENCIFDVIDCL